MKNFLLKTALFPVFLCITITIVFGVYLVVRGLGKEVFCLSEHDCKMIFEIAVLTAVPLTLIFIMPNKEKIISQIRKL